MMANPRARGFWRIGINVSDPQEKDHGLVAAFGNAVACASPALRKFEP